MSNAASDESSCRRSKMPCAMPIFKEPAAGTFQIVPTFERSHAPDDRLFVDELEIARRAGKRRGWRLRVGCEDRSAFYHRGPGKTAVSRNHCEAVCLDHDITDQKREPECVHSCPPLNLF